MTNQQDEQFSALIDGELGDSDRERLLDKVGTDAECRKRWHRYHLISDTLHSGLPDSIKPDFSSSVMSAIEKEPAILSPQSSRNSTETGKHAAHSPVTKRFAGLAIAATVAAVAVLSVQNNFKPEPEQQLATMPSSNEFVRMAPQQPSLARATPGPAVGMRNKSGGPAMTVSSALQSSSVISDPVGKSDQQLREQLYQYIVNHNQRVSGGQFQGIMPYARIVVSPGASHLPRTDNGGQAQQ
jgi:negative regulator of sigma E activity